jgi:MFS family permease
VLVGSRALQGAMAALMVPQVLSFVQVEFPAAERARAFAVYRMTFALGGVSGPLLGGLLIQADLSGLGWRPIFLVNLPVGLLALLYPLVQGHELGWPTWTFALMAASVPVLALFAAWERRKTRRDGSPLVELDLFRHQGVVGGLLTALVFFAGAGYSFVITLYLQDGSASTRSAPPWPSCRSPSGWWRAPAPPSSWCRGWAAGSSPVAGWRWRSAWRC